MKPEIRAYYTSPKIGKEHLDGFNNILVALDDKTHPFVYTKISHGFWERLAILQGHGYEMDEFACPKNGLTFDKIISGSDPDIFPNPKISPFAGDGSLAEVIKLLKNPPTPQRGMNLVASFIPFPYAGEVWGPPHRNYKVCEDLVKKLIPSLHLENAMKKKYNGYDLKAAVFTGEIVKLIELIRGRPVITIASKFNQVFFDLARLPNRFAFVIDSDKAHYQKKEIFNRCSSLINERKLNSKNLVIFCSAGTKSSFWLSQKLFEAFDKIHFIDFGNAFNIFTEKYAMRDVSTIIFRRQILSVYSNSFIELPKKIENTYLHGRFGRYGVRDTNVVNLMSKFGVPKPKSFEELPVLSIKPLESFYERRSIDHQRLLEFQSIGVSSTKELDGNYLCRIAEYLLRAFFKLKKEYRLILINSLENSFLLSENYFKQKKKTEYFRWVISALQFDSRIHRCFEDMISIDVDDNGLLDIDNLLSLPLDSYEAVIYSMIVYDPNHLCKITEFCKSNKKDLLIYNPKRVYEINEIKHLDDNCIEIIDFGGMEPWGFANVSAILCSSEQEDCFRYYESQQNPFKSKCASKFTTDISSLDAGALLDRFEKIEFYRQFYKWQEKKNFWVIENSTGLRNTNLGSPATVSPKAYSCFFSDNFGDVNESTFPWWIRRPLVWNADRMFKGEFSKAKEIAGKLFCISNSPFMHVKNNIQMIEELKKIFIEG